MSNVQATESSMTLAASAKRVREKGLNDPLFLRFLLEYIQKKFYFSSLLRNQLALPAENRLASYLLYQVEMNGSDLILEKREDMAAMLGTTTRHLNRTLQKFKREGVISLKNRHLSILNKDVLEEKTEIGT